MILSFFWSSMSKLQPLGQMSRRSVWFFSTLGFWQERIGSQKNNRVSTFPLRSRSIALISANSPPLSVKINGKYVLKERPASENRLLRKWNCFAVSEALLESIKRPNMKLQELKIKVRMTLHPMRPMTVSISTQSVIRQEESLRIANASLEVYEKENNRTQKRLKTQRNVAYGIGTVLLVALVRK